MNDQRRKKLEEAWDEATLELLMDDYAELSGEAIWNVFEQDKVAGKVPEMPADLDEHCRRLIQAHFDEPQQNSAHGLRVVDWVGSFLLHSCKAAMIAFTLIGAMATFVVSVEALRIPVLNFFLQQEDRYTIISTSDNSVSSYTYESVTNIRKFIPAEYEVVYETFYGNGYVNLRYQNEAGSIVSIRTGDSNISLSADTENAISEEIEINGNPALLIRKDGLRVILSNTDTNVMIDFYAEDMDEQSFLMLAVLLSE